MNILKETIIHKQITFENNVFSSNVSLETISSFNNIYITSYSQDLEEVFSSLNNYNKILKILKQEIKVISAECDTLKTKLSCDIHIKYILKYFEDSKTTTAILSNLRLIFKNASIGCNFYDFSISDRKQSILVKEIDEQFQIYKNKLTKHFFSNYQHNISTLNRKSNILLKPKAASIFIHEVFGHPLEKDMVEHNLSIFNENFINKKITKLNVDFKIINSIKTDLVQFGEIDDSGEKVHDEIIIDNGILKKFISTNRSSRIYDTPLNRMYNLYLKSYSSTSLNDLSNLYDTLFIVEEINNAGYDPINKICFFNCDGVIYKDNHSKKVIDIKKFSFKANIFDMFNNIINLDNSFETVIGTCIKNDQELIVCNGSCSIVLDGNYIEKELSND